MRCRVEFYFSIHGYAKELKGKVVVVTTSTQSIVYAIARRLGLERAFVVISSRRQKNVDEAVQSQKELGIDVLGMACHVKNADHRKNLIKLPYLVLTKALTSKLAPNVRVNCVAPGFVRTHLSDFIFQHEEMKEEIKRHTSIDRFDKAYAMAAVVAFLVSDDGAYITREVLPASGGIPSRL
ncbi:hypothetical protein GOP47_0014401 [Adiantum capillus-veneris]|uniref:Dehydrogenase n=1 Tax=Adiantum capillus-veneris TaxID=13818 RepID=A0A9D4ZC39_ADICA|nr:hypothetical protein GOP47_0014401 [Adiantum capillus-veneris]